MLFTDENFCMNTANSIYTTELFKGSKKFLCPSCGKRKFVPEVCFGTNDFVNEDIVGRCDGENKCGYHYTAKQYIIDHPEKQTRISGFTKPEVKVENVEPQFIHIKYIEQSMKGFNQSNFAVFLQVLFGKEVGNRLLIKYFVGRSRNDNGKACVFWQIDEQENVRYGKIMCYNALTGKRRKDIQPIAVPVKPLNYLQTFFGCHLISEYPERAIALVESEKTAIICSFFMPQYNWLATGGSSGCKWREYQVYKVLKNREVILFPDYGFYNKKTGKTCYKEWSERANAIQEKLPCKISVSKILENSLTETERDNGPDLADFLINQDALTGIALTDEGYPAIWDYKN
jgi:hypothetical protein